MTKEDVTKVFLGLLLVALAFSVLSPESETQTLVTGILTVVLLLGLISLGAERGTEVIKMVFRFVLGNVSALRSWQPSGAGSVLLALIVSYAGVTGFDVQLFTDFEPFSKLNAELVSYITIGLTWLLSSVWHNFFPQDVGKAQQLK